MRGHIYCSTRCARDAGRHAAWRAVRRRLLRPVSGRVAVVLVAMAASAPVILALRTVRELDSLSTPSPASSPRRPAPAARLDTVQDGPSGTRLEGTASEGSAVFLFAGGRFVASVPSEGGRFRFEEIREKGPYRVGAMSLSAEAAYAPTPAAPAPAPARPPIAALPVAPTAISSARGGRLRGRLPPAPAAAPLPLLLPRAAPPRRT